MKKSLNFLITLADERLTTKERGKVTTRKIGTNSL